MFRFLRSKAFLRFTSNAAATINGTATRSSAKPIAEALGEAAAKGDGTRRIVGQWYIATSSLVFGIVVLGGLTRLTESGLSITEWNVIRGMKWPSSQDEWETEFTKYRETPEYKMLNHNISMEHFKFIFFMEWIHRIWGRALGVSFVLPGAYFAYKGFMSPAIKKRTALVGSLIGLQGLLGWYMVKSGLDEEHVNNRPISVPRVSQYRLTAHLGSAFLIYGIMVSTGLDILYRHKPPAFVSSLNAALANSRLNGFKKYATGITHLVFFTSMTGGFVAGLDAGLVYNEFPQMGEGLVPSDFWALSKPTGSKEPLPWYMNFLENPSAVQFNHRWLAMTTYAAITGLWMYGRTLPLPGPSRLALNCLLGVGTAQVGLGIFTLLYFVPVPLAAAHQGGALSLMTVGLWLQRTLKRIPK